MYGIVNYTPPGVFTENRHVLSARASESKSKARRLRDARQVDRTPEKVFFLKKKEIENIRTGVFFRNSFSPLSTIFCTRSISFRVTLVQPRRRRATRVLAKRESHCGEKSVRQCRFACKNRLRAETLPTTGVEPRSYNGQRSAQHSAYGARRNERNRTNTGKRSNNSFRFGFLFRHTLVVSRIFSRVHTIVTSHKL